MKNLATLIREAQSLFPRFNSATALSYNFTLGWFPNGWQFNVTNNWYNWSDKKLIHNFGVYERPEDAVQAFLNYVKENNINVRELADF